MWVRLCRGECGSGSVGGNVGQVLQGGMWVRFCRGECGSGSVGGMQVRLCRGGGECESGSVGGMWVRLCRGDVGSGSCCRYGIVDLVR